MKTKTKPATPPPAPLFYRMGELAALLNVSPRSIRRAMDKHTLPYTRLGGAILFRKADIDATLAAATVPALSANGKRGA